MSTPPPRRRSSSDRPSKPSSGTNKKVLMANLEQLDVLRSRLRGRITDLVYSAGELTVAEIAEALVQKPTTLYRHLDLLVESGLLTEGEPVRTGKTLARVFKAPAGTIKFPRETASQAERVAVADVIVSQLRMAAKETRARIETHGPESGVRAGAVVGWLTPEDRERVAELMVEAYEILENGRREEGRTLCGLTFALRPVPRKG